MNLEKAYDKICRDELWRVLHECGVDVLLIWSISILYDKSMAYVKLGGGLGEYFEVKRGLRQRCVMSP